MRKTLVAFVLVVFGIAIGHWGPMIPAIANASGAVDHSDFIRTIAFIKTKYVKTNVNDDDLFYGSVVGTVEALGDPYSIFIKPKDVAAFNEVIYGKVSGIGAEIAKKKDDALKVVAPISGSPAAKAGLRPGDIIAEIDGVKTERMTGEEAATHIRGPAKSKIKLTIWRAGTDGPLDVVIERAEFTVESVKTKLVTVEGKKLMVVTLTQFLDNIGDKFQGAIAEAERNHVQGMVLDLRNNPGGLLEMAERLTCTWIGHKPSVYIEARGQAPVPRVNCDAAAGKLAKMPTVVLINNGSASASEVLTGALRDYGKARVMGETSYGKGCGQEIFDGFPDGARLKMTTFMWNTPHGKNIDQKGIVPDEVVKPSSDKDAAKGKDAQLDRALQYLSTGH